LCLRHKPFKGGNGGHALVHVAGVVAVKAVSQLPKGVGFKYVAGEKGQALGHEAGKGHSFAVYVNKAVASFNGNGRGEVV